MKANEIMKGGKYIAKVSGVLTTVRVDEIREVGRSRMNNYSGRLEYTDKVVYDVTNLATGRRTTFKSAAKFRRAASGSDVLLTHLKPELLLTHPKPDLPQGVDRQLNTVVNLDDLEQTLVAASEKILGKEPVDMVTQMPKELNGID